MELMGKWNWYLPSWLNWLPNLRVEAAPEPAVDGRRRPRAGTATAGGGD
jgi:hypothetical protein